MPNITKVSGTQACSDMFKGCTALITANLSTLEKIDGPNGCYGMFSGCTALTSANLSSLQSVTSYGCRAMFSGCTSLTSVSSFSALSELGREACEEMFKDSGVTTLSFPALKSTSFGSRTDQFHNMLSGVTDCMIHFPMNLNPALGSTVISSLTGYPDFGGTHTQLSFDLPATE